MGTPSYLVKGLGNPDSFMSCSHGAGRVMSRKAAKKNISISEASKAMGQVVFGSWHGKLDEAPQAYKKIEQVLAEEQDLVETVTKLQPLLVLKG
jgi:tRNA-splicing ligase RtcB